MVNERSISSLATQMKDFLQDAAYNFRIESRAERLTSDRTPYLNEDFTAKRAEGSNVFAGTAFSHLIKVSDMPCMNLSNPKPEHTTGASGKSARRRCETGPGQNRMPTELFAQKTSLSRSLQSIEDSSLCLPRSTNKRNPI